MSDLNTRTIHVRILNICQYTRTKNNTLSVILGKYCDPVKLSHVSSDSTVQHTEFSVYILVFFGIVLKKSNAHIVLFFHCFSLYLFTVAVQRFHQSDLPQAQRHYRHYIYKSEFLILLFAMMFPT